MITFERTYDQDLIRAIFTHKKIWRHLSDDGSPAPEDYYPPMGEHIWYIVVRDRQTILGIWMIHPENSVTWQIHTALLPEAWGPFGLIAAEEMARWIFEHTPCRRIITNVPVTNKLALRFAQNAGMTEYGVNKASFLKDGKLIDQICLGLSKPEVEETVMQPTPDNAEVG